MGAAKQPQHPIPETLQHPSAPCVSSNALTMVPTVNFYNEFQAWRHEVCDVTVTNEHLPAEGNPKLTVRYCAHRVDSDAVSP
jgi:hypothetical protein